MSLIYVKHPLRASRENQEQILATCDEKRKLYYALMFNYGNAAFLYHQVEPTQEEYEEWLEILPEKVRNTFTEKGYEKSKSTLALKRFTNEMKDIGLEAYIQNLLKPEDYKAINEIGMDE